MRRAEEVSNKKSHLTGKQNYMHAVGNEDRLGIIGLGKFETLFADRLAIGLSCSPSRRTTAPNGSDRCTEDAHLLPASDFNFSSISNHKVHILVLIGKK